MPDGQSTGSSPKAPTRWPRVGSALLSLIVLVAALGVAGSFLLAYPPPPLPSLAPQHLTMVIETTPGSTHYSFAPGNFTVSSQSVVDVTIYNWDTEASPVSLYSAEVLGVQGAQETVTASPSSPPTVVQSLSVTDVSHTFSVDAGSTYQINVPIPPALRANVPSEVQFQLYLSHPGTYTWWCAAPCGPLPMVSGGGMAGTLTVT